MPLSFTGFAVEGPIARTVGDVRLALRVMQAPDPRDPIAVPFESPRYDAGQTPKRVAIVTDPGTHSFAGRGRPETEDAVRVAGTWLAESGYQVEEVSLPLLDDRCRELVTHQWANTGHRSWGCRVSVSGRSVTVVHLWASSSSAVPSTRSRCSKPPRSSNGGRASPPR
ncbi:amidase family protein [Streptomyces sp. NL15-2K]|uniref:amidase family protein n=1 Tax=Streptomyces sp. NL15-2K TaxID=376149 RepID=UPI000F560384|nr:MULTISPECIES: amidase family protein [Actinomycetes]WKX08631.1 amidase family protein [Kutzneria buriramensis]